MVVGVYGGKPSEDGGVKQDTTALECERFLKLKKIEKTFVAHTRGRSGVYHDVLIRGEDQDDGRG